jgi:hypothetical protein
MGFTSMVSAGRCLFTLVPPSLRRCTSLPSGRTEFRAGPQMDPTGDPMGGHRRHEVAPQRPAWARVAPLGYNLYWRASSRLAIFLGPFLPRPPRSRPDGFFDPSPDFSRLTSQREYRLVVVGRVHGPGRQPLRHGRDHHRLLLAEG